MHPGSAPLLPSEHVQGHGQTFFKSASEHALEGIVSKRMTSTYFQGRTRSWLKFKFTKSDEFIVLGFTKVRRSRLAVGQKSDKNQLVIAFTTCYLTGKINL